MAMQGQSNRAVAGHALNARSSRSHTIFTLWCETMHAGVFPSSSMAACHLCSQKAMNLFTAEAGLISLQDRHRLTQSDMRSRQRCLAISGCQKLTRSSGTADGSSYKAKLNMVDLAGSERSSKTGAQGSIAREALHINKSLSFLEQVPCSSQ
jgi:hypothetical protein